MLYLRQLLSNKLYMANVLIVRYHRIGDALIVIPLITALAKKYEKDTFTLLTNERFESLQELMPSNVRLLPMRVKKTRGIFRGISFSIRKKLYAYSFRSFIRSFDKIAFLQYDVLEAKTHRYIIKTNKKIDIAVTDETAFLSEERARKKCSDGLTMIKLHQHTLQKLGYTDLIPDTDASKIKNRDTSSLFAQLKINPDKKLIAISPFSREETKIYPLEKMEQIVAHYASKDNYQVLIFGGGPYERKIASSWENKYPAAISLIDRVSFKDETTILANCNAALSMDSANLHLGALLNIPVFSIWGATTPQNGYYPSNLNIDYAIIKNIDCQPCSIFGNKPCTNPKKYDCLDIEPDIIINKLNTILEK